MGQQTNISPDPSPDRSMAHPQHETLSGGRWSTGEELAVYTVIDPPLGQSLPVVHKLCAHHKSESAFPSVCGSKQVTIGFHLLILGWKDTELRDLFPTVRLTGLSEWWVDDGSARSSGCPKILLRRKARHGTGPTDDADVHPRNTWLVQGPDCFPLFRISTGFHRNRS